MQILTKVLLGKIFDIEVTNNPEADSELIKSKLDYFLTGELNIENIDFSPVICTNIFYSHPFSENGGPIYTLTEVDGEYVSALDGPIDIPDKLYVKKLGTGALACYLDTGHILDTVYNKYLHPETDPTTKDKCLATYTRLLDYLTLSCPVKETAYTDKNYAFYRSIDLLDYDKTPYLRSTHVLK